MYTIYIYMTYRKVILKIQCDVIGHTDKRAVVNCKQNNITSMVIRIKEVKKNMNE